MPTYEYRCLACQHQYEKREGFDAAPLQKCPNCGGSARRVLHAPPVLFKGSGFYVTDSRTASAAEGEATSVDSKPDGDKANKDAAPAAADTTTPADTAASTT